MKYWEHPDWVTAHHKLVAAHVALCHAASDAHPPSYEGAAWQEWQATVMQPLRDALGVALEECGAVQERLESEGLVNA